METPYEEGPVRGYQDTMVRFNHRSWSQMLVTSAEDKEPTYAELVEMEQCGDVFVEGYAKLIQALRDLPKLRKLSYAGGHVGTGLCQVSRVDVEQHSGKHDDWRNLFGGPGQPDMSYSKVSHRWSGGDVVTALMTYDIVKWHAVDFHQPLPACRGIKDDRMLAREDYRAPIRGIESLRLTVPGSHGWSELFEDFFAADAENLRHLIFTVSSSVDRAWRELPREVAEGTRSSPQEWRDEIFLCEVPLEVAGSVELSSLTIEGTPRIPNALIAEETIKLLRCHRNTLRSVNLRNVWFPASEDDDQVVDFDAATPTRDVLQALKDLHPDTCIEWTVRRLGCVPSCEFLHTGEHTLQGDWEDEGNEDEDAGDKEERDFDESDVGGEGGEGEEADQHDTINGDVTQSDDSNDPDRPLAQNELRLQNRRGNQQAPDAQDMEYATCERYSAPYNSKYVWSFTWDAVERLAVSLGAVLEEDPWNFARADILVRLPDLEE